MTQNNIPIIVRIYIVNKISNTVFVIVFKLAHQGNIIALMIGERVVLCTFTLKPLHSNARPSK